MLSTAIAFAAVEWEQSIPVFDSCRQNRRCQMVQACEAGKPEKTIFAEILHGFSRMARKHLLPNIFNNRLPKQSRRALLRLVLLRVDHVIDRGDDEQGEQGRGEEAEYQRPGQAREDRVEGDGPGAEGGGGGSEQNRPQAHRPALQQGLLEGQALFEGVFHKFDQHHRIPHHDAA